MLSTFLNIVKENVTRWRQILHLAMMEIKKSTRGAALGWIWLLIKPLVYLTVFWFALDLGLRGAKTVGDYPYLLWLASGIFSWFFMSAMITGGANVYRKYSYLVKRIPFPLSCISTVFAVSKFVVPLMLYVLVFGIAFVTGYGVSIYAIQVPIGLLVMFIFFVFYSMMLSPFCAASKDFSFAIAAISTPLFWASGVIFNLDAIKIPIVHAVLAWNPVTFFVRLYRAGMCDRYWIWERPEVLIPFIIVFVATVIAAVYIQKKMGKGVADVL